MLNNRILIAEDDPDLSELVHEVLADKGFAPIAARDGQQALDLIDRCHPDLVLLDIGLPVLDGFEVLRRLRRYSHIPVVMLSSHTDVSYKVKSFELGAHDYVTKPFSVNVLAARCRAVLRHFILPYCPLGAKPLR